MFNDFKIISKLMILITIFVIGFVLFGVVAYQTIDSIKINGKMYNEIVSGKDLVADILPPPEYIIESYLTALQLSKETDKTKIENLINYEAQLKKEYDNRHEVWVSGLPEGDIKKTMIEDSYKPAMEFFDVFKNEFIPAVKSGDKEKANEILPKLDKFYSEHRTNINKVVSLANIKNSTIEENAKNTINTDLLILNSLAISILSIAIALGLIIASGISKQIKKVDIKNKELDLVRLELLTKNKELEEISTTDSLTGLSNRKKMLQNISTLLEDKNEKFAVFFIDLDNFKNINDNLGHHAGDTILKAVAVRLNGIIRSSDTISRVGGDEFIIILKHLKLSANVEKIVTDIATAIGTTLRTAFTYNGNTMFLGASIGISIFPEHGTDVDTLINNADLAMYKVKHNGGYGYNIYSSSMNNKSIDKLRMKTKLNNAMSNNEFITYYQPIIDLKSMKISSAEALIRWKQGDTIIPPAEFIPIAKSIGEMVAIDNWMIENACIQCKKWQVLGAKKFSVSVNTSYKQLKQVNFVELVINILKSNSLSPKYLNLEITEDDTLEEPELIISILTKLKVLGIKISLDDFGTGYSSLNYVNMLPIDTIKIDKSLVMGLESGSKNIFIIKSIIVMAHSLNIKVVTEGIETETQFHILKELGCDSIQGYLIGKPMTTSDFEEKFIKQVP